MTRVPDVLLDLPLLPSGGWVAELGLEQEVADHRREAHVDLALLSPPDFVDGGAHVVVDAAPRHAAQHAKGVVVVKGFGRRPHRDRMRCHGAGVRKPPMEETAGRMWLCLS